MPVDLILSDASLLRRQYKYESHETLAHNYTSDRYQYLRGLGYADYFDIHIKYIENNSSPWVVSQIDFFKFVDLISLLMIHKRTSVTQDDIRPFRPVLAATKIGPSEFLVVQALYGITDDAAYIDNYYNTINFTLEGISSFLLILNDLLEKKI